MSICINIKMNINICTNKIIYVYMYKPNNKYIYIYMYKQNNICIYVHIKQKMYISTNRITNVYMYKQKNICIYVQDDQLERTFSSYVRIQVVVLNTYLGRWTIGRSGERGSGISVLPARYDDDDGICTNKMIYVYMYK